MTTEAFVKTRWISRVETAKLIRAKLKQEYPGVKFSVRCARGSATYVNWTDGPTSAQVRATVDEFESDGFDGMQDLRYTREDNVALVANEDGTLERVRYLSGLILEQRNVSEEWARELRDEIEEFNGEAIDWLDHGASIEIAAFRLNFHGTPPGTGLARDSGGGGGCNYAQSLIWQLAAGRDRSRPCDHGLGTYGVGNGWHRCAGCGLRCQTP